MLTNPSSRKLLIQPAKALKFCRVTKSDDDVRELFCILESRSFGISHQKMPSYEEHRKFVKHHPYRFWYIIKINGLTAGSLYFNFDNSIGLSMPECSPLIIESALRRAIRLHRPLSRKASLRPGHFFINVNPQNRPMQGALKKLGWTPLQVSYADHQRS
jgi:hypothetical protein